jgi:hypothetical protein
MKAMKYAGKVLLGTAIAGLLAVVSITAVAAAEQNKRAVVGCTGGAQEAVVAITSDSPTTSASTTFVPIANTTVSAGASGGIGDFDTYLVTFAGEANNQLAGSWFARALVSINGGAFTSINPVGPNTFHSGKKANNNAMTWCTRIQATSSAVFHIEWSVTSGSTAVIDDYITSVQRSN